MERWLKSEPINLQFKKDQIDVENGIIRDVVMAEVGPAKGHGFWMEAGFIEKLVAYDVKHYSDTGIKARFGHPAMSNTSMGKQLGYFKNFRADNGRALADLHLLDSANLSPSNPGMKDWMLSMAAEASDFVMSSIAFKTFSYYQYDPESKAKVSLSLTPDKQPIAKYQGERVYVDFEENQGSLHLYTDMVEAGAATNALFSQQFNQDKFAVRVVEFLQENTDILSFIQANPQKVTEMCDKLNIPIEMDTKKEKIGLWRKLESILFNEGEAEEAVEEVAEVVAETETPEEEVIQEETVALSVVEELREELRAAQEMATQLQTQVEALEKKPLADPVTYEEEPGGGEGANEFMCATTMKAMGRK